MIVHCFIARDDDWVIGHHLAAYSTFCDRIVCVLDEWPQSEAICRRFPKCEVHHRQRLQSLPDHDDNGPIFEEGLLRQRAWDLAMTYSPDLVVLGDTDEAPTPDVVAWLRSDPDPAVEVWYADWVNLAGGLRTAMGGERNPWSFENPGGNKKGLVVRPVPGKQYRYRPGTQHVRMEPSPLNESRAVLDDAHRMAPVKLVHYHYANWQRWQSQKLSQTPKYKQMTDGTDLVVVPPTWLWPFAIEGVS